MKITFQSSEVESLIRVISQKAEFIRFNTTYESRITTKIIREFVRRLVVKLTEPKKKYSIKIDEITLLALNEVLPQMYPEDPYDQANVLSIIKTINQACLNI